MSTFPKQHKDNASSLTTRNACGGSNGLNSLKSHVSNMSQKKKCSNQNLAGAVLTAVEENQDGDVVVNDDFVNSTVFGKYSKTADSIEDDGVASRLNDVTKRNKAEVRKCIRELIKEGAIVGIPIEKSPKGRNNRQIEYSYQMNPLYRPHDFKTTPVLCLSKDRKTPLRVFDSIQDCADKLQNKLTADNVLKVCRGTKNSCRGLFFAWWEPGVSQQSGKTHTSSDFFNSLHSPVSIEHITSNYMISENNSNAKKLHDDGEKRISKRRRKGSRFYGDEYEKLESHNFDFEYKMKQVQDEGASVRKGEVPTCTVLICDGCDDEYYMEQIGLSKIPKGDWFCDACNKKLNSSTQSGETENDETGHSIVFLGEDAYAGEDSYSTCSQHNNVLVNSQTIVDAIQNLSESKSQVTFRAICQQICPGIISQSYSTSTTNTYAVKADEKLILAIIEKLEALLIKGHVIERVNGKKTPGVNFPLSGRRGRALVKAPGSVYKWPSIVRFYDDDNDLDCEGTRVPLEKKKLYEINSRYLSSSVASKKGVCIHSTTKRGTFLRSFRSALACAKFFCSEEALVLQCCNGVVDDVGGIVFEWKPEKKSSSSLKFPSLSITQQSSDHGNNLLLSTPLLRLALQCCEALVNYKSKRGEFPVSFSHEEIYASFLSQFASQGYRPFHIEDSLLSLHRRGFLTLHHSCNDSFLKRVKALGVRAPLLHYRLNQHYRSDLMTAAVLCSWQDKPLLVFSSVFEAAMKLGLREESILKVCLRSNVHCSGGSEEEYEDKRGNPLDLIKWPKSHANLKFKWADEMTQNEESSLSSATVQTDEETMSYIRSVMSSSNYSSSNKDDIVIQKQSLRNSSVKKQGMSDLKPPRSHTSAISPSFNDNVRRLLAADLRHAPVGLSDIDSPSEKSRRSINVSSSFNANMRRLLQDGDEQSQPVPMFSASIEAYCHRHGILESSITDLIPVNLESNADDSGADEGTSRSISSSYISDDEAKLLVEQIKRSIFDVGSVIRVKLCNNKTKMSFSRVAVITSVNHISEEDVRYTVFTGTLPLHSVRLEECGFEDEDLVWDTCHEMYSGSAMKSSVEMIREKCTKKLKEMIVLRRWTGAQAECVLPMFLKKPIRTRYFTLEPDLDLIFETLKSKYPSKTMKELVRLYYFVSDPRERGEIRDKDRKDIYRGALRVFLFSDFLHKSSTLPNEDDILEWLSILCSYNFSDLFA